MAKVSFDVVRMRACYAKPANGGHFVSLICYSYHDEEAETEVKVTKTKLTLSYEVTEKEAEKEKHKRFLYPDNSGFAKAVAFGIANEMLPADFKV
jgi:hypothetical protein